jgi:predicted permease
MLTRLVLSLLPARWRESVARDLAEEARDAGHSGVRADLWMFLHVLRIVGRFVRTPSNVRVEPASRAWNLSVDVRFAVRSLRREPLTTLAIAGTLALGTGAATATYAVVNYTLLRPVPGVVDESRLISVYIQPDAVTPNRTSVSHAHLVAMRDRATAVSGLAAWRVSEFPTAAASTEAPRTTRFMTVTRGFFEVLGVVPRIGRLFTAEEYESTGSEVVVISERLWRARFASDPAIVGRRLYLRGHNFEIIGVARGFHGLDRMQTNLDGWVTRASEATFNPADGATSGNSSFVARLVSGATIDVAQAQLTAAFKAAGEWKLQERTYWPIVFEGLGDGVGVTRSRVAATLRVMLAGVGLLVVLACANAANLLLARHRRRRSDLIVRHALGASRARLVREMLVEAVALASLAGVAGLAVGSMLTSLFRSSRLLSYLPVLSDLSVDWRVGTFCALVSACTVLLFGLAPAVLAARADVRSGAGSGGRATRSAGWFRTALVATQVALSFALVVAAALLVQSVHRLQSVDFGFSPDAVVGFSFRPTRVISGDPAITAALRATHDRLGQTSGLGPVALAFMSPLGGVSGSELRRSDQQESQAARIASHDVTGEYFAVLGIPLVHGRTFTAAESFMGREEGTPIILNAALATRLFGITDVVGRTVLQRGRVARGRTWQTRPIIGVASSVVGADVREGKVPFAYEPFGRSRVATVLLRPEIPIERASGLIRSAVAAVAPAVPVDEIVPLRREADEEIAQERVLTRLSLVLGAIAALLALAGLYASIAQSVTEQMREYAIRAAVGASRPAIAVSILRRAAGTAACGIAAGVVLVMTLAGLLTAYLYQVRSGDPATMTIVAAALSAAVLAAATPAALRAARVDPAKALRAD